MEMRLLGYEFRLSRVDVNREAALCPRLPPYMHCPAPFQYARRVIPNRVMVVFRLPVSLVNQSKSCYCFLGRRCSQGLIASGWLHGRSDPGLLMHSDDRHVHHRNELLHNLS
jgi:hypothetical protein